MSFEARYVQRGDIIDYTPVNATPAGTVVQFGPVIGIAKTDIPAGELGALAITGVYEVAKATGAITFGAPLYWDNSNKRAATSGSIPLGIAVTAAESADATVRVCINVGFGSEASS